MRKNKILLIAFSLIFLSNMLCSNSVTAADQVLVLPKIVEKWIGRPLKKVGEGEYTKFAFSIYNAALWSPSGEMLDNKPYALQLRYSRSLSKETIVDAVYEGIEEQGVAGAETLAIWKDKLNEVLPSVKDGDELVGLSVPKGDTRLYFNGKLIASIKDRALSDAFFNIWFGEHADKTLLAELTDEILKEDNKKSMLNRRKR